MKPKMVRRAQTDIATLAKIAQIVEHTEANRPAGFAAGSIVLTSKGETPVEDLRAGDRVITRNKGMARLTSVKAIASPTAYCVRASVLGHGRPANELLVAEGQRILLRDWRAKAIFGQAEALVPVARLADGHYISRETGTDTLFYALAFETPHILYVDGIEMASAPPTETTL